MSEKRVFDIACPRCKHPIAAELYESINVRKDPELRDLLLQNQVNAVTCPGCRFAFRIDKPLLYCDPGRNILIYWLPASEESQFEGDEKFSAMLRETSGFLPADLRAPDVQLVHSRTELVERIFLLEAGLNERLIEYIKYLIYSQNGHRLNPATKILLFNAEDSTEENLCFVIQDAATLKFEAMLQYSRDAYKAMSEIFLAGEKSGDLLELLPGPHVSARAIFLRELRKESAQRE
jgi:hypothetical protein